MDKVTLKRWQTGAVCPTLEPSNFPKPMERETRQLSLLSLDSQARIRLTTRQSSSVFSRLRSTGENIRTTFEHSSLTIQSYHRREDPFDIQARHKYSPLIINLNDHRLHSRENGNSPSTSNFLPAKLVKG